MSFGILPEVDGVEHGPGGLWRDCGYVSAETSKTPEAVRFHASTTVTARMLPIIIPADSMPSPMPQCIHVSHSCLPSFQNVSRHIQSSNPCFPARESDYLFCITFIFCVERLFQHIAASYPSDSEDLFVHRMQAKFSFLASQT